MSVALSVSLVIVSHGRPGSLKRLLRALRHQTLAAFQTIVVTDGPAGDVEDVLYVPFAERNISAARNAGLLRAVGDVVAYCDDDCVPEPSWLERLTAPFSDPAIGAAGGFVRNQRGVAYQTKAVLIDRCARDRAVDVDETKPWTVPAPPAGHHFKTVGTNCAFRRAALLDIGGFGEDMRFFLEDADVNFRLANAGWSTAIVPSAEVHHGLHAGPYRHADGVPADLFEVGRSLALFLRKHCEPERITTAVQAIRVERFASIGRLQSAGRVSGAESERLKGSLEAGIVSGFGLEWRNPLRMKPLPAPGGTNQTIHPAMQRVVIFARPFRRRLARRLASDLADAGNDVTLIDFRPGLRPLAVRYLDAGYWLHRGGSFGRGDRSGPRFCARTVQRRCLDEFRRMAGQRKFDVIFKASAWTQAACRRAYERKTTTRQTRETLCFEGKTGAIAKPWQETRVAAFVSPQCDI